MQEDEIINCPDCQLQAQHQQQSHVQLQSNHQHLLSNTNIQIKDQIQQYQARNYDQIEAHELQTNGGGLDAGFQGKDQISNGGMASYKTTNNPLLSSVQCNSVQSMQSGGPSSVSLPLASTSATMSNPADMLNSGSSCLSSIPVDGCDVNGYCATCAVLDLPTNDKYYRSSIPGHSVFPPMFYRQAPPIPGFSPIPDCGPWSNCNSNDFGPYSYTSYSQQAPPGDYYSACGMLQTTQSTAAEAVNQAQSSCSFSFPSSDVNSTILGKENECLKKLESSQESPDKTTFIDEAGNEDDDSIIPICISSSSEETSDSDSYVSQREVIVEDIDEDDGGSVSMSLCNIDRNQKCSICLNLIMVECPSPLANILENIHEDITAEDLDITVSSGDIEIGGIEDEVRDFHAKKSSNPVQITFNRLAFLLDIPLSEFRAMYELGDSTQKSHEAGNTLFAPLCTKCGRMASSIDTLEKQLRASCTALKESLQRHFPINQMKPTCSRISDALSTLPLSGAIAENNIFLMNVAGNCNPPDSSSCQAAEGSFSSCNYARFICKQTQTDPILECSKDCILSFDAVSNAVSTFQKITSTKDTMTDYQDTLTLNSSSSLTDTGSHYSQRKEDTGTQVQAPDDPQLINFPELNLNYSHLTNNSLALDSNNQENFEIAPDSPMGNLNLGTDIHDFTCSFIPALTRDKEDIFSDSSSNSSAGSIEPIPDDSSSASSSNPLGEQLQSRHSYLCEECGKVLSCERTFENHLRGHHNDFIHKCHSCLKGFVNEASLKIHVRTHTGEKPFQCRHCKKPFASKSNMISHEEICKEVEASVPASGNVPIVTVVDVVKTPLVSDSKCNKPSEEDDSKKLKCKKCGICFRLKERLEQHTVKGCKSKVLECSHCSKKFSKRSEMNIHLLIHDGMKPYFCDICGISFSTKGNQIAHTRTHSLEKRFKCSLCDKGFHRKQALQLHYNRHNGMKPYSCTICERKFYDPSNLQNHKKTHHKNSL